MQVLQELKLADGLKQCYAADSRQHEVQEEAVGSEFREARQGGGRVCGYVDLVALLFEGGAKDGGCDPVVVDYENALNLFYSSSIGRIRGWV